MKKIIVIAISIMALASMSFVFAKADDAATGNSGNANSQGKNSLDWQQKKLDLQNQKQARIDQRCATVQQRISDRLANFSSLDNKHMAVYTNMQNRIQKFITKLSSAVPGLDVSEVTADLTELQTKISQFSTDYSAYITKLGDVKTFKCGTTDPLSNADLRAKLTSARQALVTVHQDAMAIRTFMRTDIVPDILALKKQKALQNAAANAGSADENKTGTENDTDTTNTIDENQQ